MSGTEPQRGVALPTREEQEARLWAGVRRQESSWATLFAAILLLLTLYFAGLNAYVLRNAVPRPLRLSLEVPAGTQLSGAYRPQLIWKPMAARPGQVVRPILWIGDEALRDSGASRLVELGRSSDLRFTVPQNTTGGTHRGTLLLTRVSGDSSLPATVSAPVSIGVTSGFWRNWFILRDWAIFALVAAAGFYLFCMMVYYPPGGALRVVRLGPTVPYEKNIVVRMRPMAWLMPWKRSIVPLRWIWKRVGIGSNAIKGNLDFENSAQPYLCLPGVGRRKVLKRLSNSPPAAAEPFAPTIRMADHIFTFEIGASHRVEIQYLRPGSLPAGRAPGGYY